MSEHLLPVAFAMPWVWLLLPLPLVMRALGPARATDGALRATGLLAGLAGDDRRPPAGARAVAVLAGLGWCLLVFAAARPLWPAAENVVVARRDLLVAIDLSASMATADLTEPSGTVTRAAAARALLDDLLARRPDDRVGVIVFGSQAYLQTPLTADRRAVLAALDEARIGLAGPETALGDAVALAVGRLRELPAASRTVVLLTDGASTAGTLSPERAAWLAAREGVRVHAVGIGSDRGLDESALRQIAGQSGGSYRRATDAAALERFADEFEALEPRVVDSAGRPLREGYPLPLGGALLIAAALLLHKRRRIGGVDDSRR